MGNSERLKWNRKELGLSQKELAQKAGLSLATIGRLEQDETRWDVITDETFDKIAGVFDNASAWPFIKRDTGTADICVEETSKSMEELEKNIAISFGLEEKMYEQKKAYDNKEDKATLELLEFAFEGLKEAESHEDFTANVKLMKRILNRF